jgi:hypothetical protein
MVVRNHKRRNRRHNPYPPDRLGHSRADWVPTLQTFELLPPVDVPAEGRETQPESYPGAFSEPVADDV